MRKLKDTKLSGKNGGGVCGVCSIDALLLQGCFFFWVTFRRNGPVWCQGALLESGRLFSAVHSFTWQWQDSRQCAWMVLAPVGGKRHLHVVFGCAQGEESDFLKRFRRRKQRGNPKQGPPPPHTYRILTRQQFPS